MFRLGQKNYRELHAAIRPGLSGHDIKHLLSPDDRPALRGRKEGLGCRLFLLRQCDLPLQPVRSLDAHHIQEFQEQILRVSPLPSCRVLGVD